MDAVKKYIFWVVVGVVLLAGAGFWFMTVPGLQAQTKELNEANQTKMIDVETKAKKSKDIRNQRYVDAAKDYQKHLEKQQGEILGLLKDKKIVLGDEFEKAPDALLDFNNVWTRDIREKIKEEAKKNELSLPGGEFAAQILFDDSGAKDAPQRRDRILRLALAQEVIRILSTRKVTVTRPKFEPKLTEPEGSETVSLGAYSLDSFAILTDREMESRLAGATKRAYDNAGAAQAVSKTPPVKAPVNSMGLQVTFTAAPAAVAEILKGFETSERFFGSIVRIDTQRAVDVYPAQSQLGRIVPGTTKDAEAHKINSHFQEGPVQVLVLVELLSYDESKAKDLAGKK